MHENLDTQSAREPGALQKARAIQQKGGHVQTKEGGLEKSKLADTLI